MENKRLLQLQTQLDKLSNEMDSVKESVNFDKLLVEYKKVKKDIYKINEKIRIAKDKHERTHDLQLQLKDLEKLKSNDLNSFKKVEVVERKMFALKQQVLSEITTLDRRKNPVDYRISNFESQNERQRNIISDKYNASLEKKVTALNKEIDKIQKEIAKFKEDKKPTTYLNYDLQSKRSEQTKIKHELKFNNAAKIVNVEKLIDINQTQIDKLTITSKKYEEEINYGLEMLTKIDSKLSFRDEDEINTNLSFQVKHLDVFYGNKQALFDVNIELPKNEVIAIIGPSGCGKSTFLRTLNRINDNISTFSAKGKILLDGEYDIYKLKSVRNRYDKIELSTLRTKVGMIFQQPNPFPMSIYKNVAYGPSVKGIKNKSVLNKLVEQSLKDAGLYEEVKDNLKALGTSLSGGQQQRLCIARAIANEPEVLLMDEPTSALDPIASAKIEELIMKLKEHYTIIMVTHSMQQAQRISDKTAFFYQGKLIEYGETKQIFKAPKEKETKEYISGKFG